MEKCIGELIKPTGHYPRLLSSHTFKDAIFALTNYTNFEKNCYPLVLIYEDNVLVGHIGFSEILKIIEPVFLKENIYGGWSIDPDLFAIFWKGLFSTRCSEVYKKTLKDFMQPVNYVVKTSDPLIKAIHIMIKQNLEAIVVKEGERFAGVLHRNEIFNEIANLIEVNTYSLSTAAS